MSNNFERLVQSGRTVVFVQNLSAYYLVRNKLKHLNVPFYASHEFNTRKALADFVGNPAPRLALVVDAHQLLPDINLKVSGLTWVIGDDFDHESTEYRTVMKYARSSETPRLTILESEV